MREKESGVNVSLSSSDTAPREAAAPQRSPDTRPATRSDARPDNRLAQRFADTLARGEREGKDAKDAKSGKASDRDAPRLDGKGVSFARVTSRGDDETSGHGSSDGGALAMATPVTPPTPAKVEAMARALAEANPVIERMAAAIAEVADKGAAHEMTVSFDARTAGDLASGAIIVRDAATGALSIRVTGLVPQVGEARRAALESDLRRGLERRRLTIGTIEIEGIVVAGTRGGGART